MQKNITFCAILSVLAVILFSLHMFIPIIGVAISFFSFLPLMIVNHICGKKYFFMSLITTFVISIFFNDPFGWIFLGFFIIPVTISLNSKKIVKFLMFLMVEIGAFLMFRILSFEESSFDSFFKQIWFLIGIVIFFTLYIFYKRTFYYSLYILKKSNIDINMN